MPIYSLRRNLVIIDLIITLRFVVCSAQRLWTKAAHTATLSTTNLLKVGRYLDELFHVDLLVRKACLC